MHPFPNVRARALRISSLAIVAVLMCQAPAFAETMTPPAPAPPTISTLSSRHGVVDAAAEVVIGGTNFVSVTAVAFGSTPSAAFTARSSTSITALAPALPAGTYRIAVTTVAGTTVGASYTVRTFEAEVLRLVNDARGASRKCGKSRYKATGPLRWDATLAHVAASHSRDMADNDYFSHKSRDGRTPFQRMKKAGYRYYSAGENIAAGFRSPASVVTAWLNSPGHCRNLMNRRYKELGVGFATGGTYGNYWTQDFGNPR